LLLIPVGLTALILLWLLWLNPAAAATVTMTKDGGGNWSDPTLWDTGTVPAVGDTVIIAAAETALVALDGPVTVARLEIVGPSVSKWQTLTVTGQALTVTGDLLLKNYAKLYQGAGGQVTAGRFFVVSAASGRVAWETRGTASQRARVVSPSGSINVNTDPANGGSATAGSAIEQDIQWNDTDFVMPGPTVLPLAGTNIARLQVDHCYWDNTGYLDFGQYARGATLLSFTNNDVRLRGSNAQSRKPGTSAMLTLKRAYDAAPSAVDLLQGNVITWIPATNEVAFIYLYSAGGAGRVWDNVFQDISLNLTFTSDALIEPGVFDVAGNLFFLTESVTIPGAEIQSRYGATIRDNLFMARSVNSHLIKLSSAIQGPPDTVAGNVFDVADPDADIIMLGHSSATITQNLFLGGGTPINMGLSATNDAYRNLVDLDSATSVVTVRRNTVYTRGAAAISGIFIWEGETSYHGGSVTIANNLVAEWSYNPVMGMASDDYLIGQVFPNSVDWTDYTWWWNDTGGTLEPYYSITITGKTAGADLGFGLHDQEGDPHFKNKSARVLTMDAYLQGTPEGDEMRALSEFKKRNENVFGEVYIAQYNVPVALNYLRAAFTPMNLALNDSGLDGEDIGAIDMTSLPAVPSAPTLVSGTVTSLTLEWPEPPGSVVGDYDLQYRLAGEADWTDYAISYIEFLKNLQNYAKTTATGLQTGASYEFRVRAGNGLGYSAWSPASAALIVMGPPGLPTGLSALGLDRSARLAFTAPVNTGGVALTGYAVTVSPGGMVVQGTESPLTIPDLVNSVSYTLALTASNAGYTGPAATITVTPHEPLPPAPPELLTLRRAPGEAFDWQYQFAVAPTTPGETCIEGQHAWDDTYLYVCIPGGRWVYVQPNKLW
jgi:hypothetical protein